MSFVSNDLLFQAYQIMLTARLTEQKLSSLNRSGKIYGGVFLGKGQEALSVSLALHLKKGDIYAPLIRDQAGRLAFGDTILDTMRTYLGSSLGSMRGRDGNIHRGRPKEGYYAMISHLGVMISTVTGALLARRMKGEKGVVGATCIGDGGTSTGSFHEGLNIAAIEKLPLVVVIANNQYAYSTPNEREFACADLLDKASGYGITGHRAEGTSLENSLSVLGDAVAAARAGKGPQLVVASLLRLVGHAEHDDAFYVTDALKKSPLGRDCLLLAREDLLSKGIVTEERLQELQEEIQQEIETITAKVLREPAPNPAEEKWSAYSSSILS